MVRFEGRTSGRLGPSHPKIVMVPLHVCESPRTLGVRKPVGPTVEDRMGSVSLPPVCSVQKALRLDF